MRDLDYIANFPLGAEYVDMVEEATTAPRVYHYAALLTVAGANLTDRVWFPYIGKLRPNLYTCLVGASALSLKSTSMRLVQPLATVAALHGLATMEGLVAQLAKVKHLLVSMEELSGMFMKAKGYGAKNGALLSRLIELYDCPQKVDLYTKKDPIRVENPILSILAASTPELLEQSMEMSDIYGGLANRFMFIVAPDVLQMPSPYPTSVDSTEFGKLLAERIGRWTADTELMWPEESRELWGEYYRVLQEELLTRSETGRILSVRAPEQTLKVAMIIHALEGDPRGGIEAQHLSAAIDFMEYVRESVSYMAPVFSPLESKVLHIIEQQGTISRGKLHQKLTGKVKGVELTQAVESLIKFRRIVEEEGKFKIVERETV